MKRPLLLILLLAFTALPLQAAEYVEGTHYARLAVPVATQDPAKVEVVEVFSYACIHCKNFDPWIERWRAAQSEDVQFRRIPAVFNETWEILARAFYAADVLGVSEKVHTPLFEAIHDKGVDLLEPSLMATLFEDAAGVPQEQFEQVYNSMVLNARVANAHGLGLSYGISGVPTLIVGGRYRVDGRMAGSNTDMLAVADQLIAQIRAEQALDAAEPGAQ